MPVLDCPFKSRVEFGVQLGLRMLRMRQNHNKEELGKLEVENQSRGVSLELQSSD